MNPEEGSYLLESISSEPRYGSFSQINASKKLETQEYEVQAGDTLQGIAIRYKTTIQMLKMLNKNLYFESTLSIGDLILLPSDTAKCDSGVSESKFDGSEDTETYTQPPEIKPIKVQEKSKNSLQGILKGMDKDLLNASSFLKSVDRDFDQF